MKDNRKVYRCAYGMIRVMRNANVDGGCLEFGISPYFYNKEQKLEIDLKYPEGKEFIESDDFKVGDPVELTTSVDELKSVYEKLIRTCIKMRLLSRGYSEDGPYDKISDNLISWLKGTDFYDAPASTRFHEAFKHGLLVHTLNVYNNICDLWKLDKFHDVDIYSAALVALVHDWCKIGLYEVYQKNVKENGTWKQVDAFKRNSPSYPLGHGETSMFLADRFCKLTPEEATAIRWHMGKWYCHDAVDNDLQTANETFPLVHMLQFADQLSITNY